MADDTTKPADDTPPQITLTITKSGHHHPLTLPAQALLSDLLTATTLALQSHTPTTTYDWPKAKFIFPGGRLLRANTNPTTPIAPLLQKHPNKPITLQVPTAADVAGMQAASDAARARDARLVAQRKGAVPARTTARRGDGLGVGGSGFLRIEPLMGLPAPERSRAVLVRLAEDVGIREVMRKHGFSGTFEVCV